MDVCMQDRVAAPEGWECYHVLVHRVSAVQEIGRPRHGKEAGRETRGGGDDRAVNNIVEDVEARE